ncbi:hypothetical protein P4S72_22150 [Vibrio sp. PP-XX7]
MSIQFGLQVSGIIKGYELMVVDDIYNINAMFRHQWMHLLTTEHLN